MSENYNPKPTKWTHCIICGERLTDGDIQGCQRRKGGKVGAHKACWEKEQAERARRSKP